jgi:hypothetical protein
MRLNGTLEYQMKYRSDELRGAYLRKKYLVTIEMFNEMAKDGCQICGNTPKKMPLHIDHDHKCCRSEELTCGKCVRGVVCNRCNQTIGKYENGLIRPDNPLLDKIAEYLMKYNHKRYDETNKHNAIIADNIEEFMAKLDGGKNV